MSKSNAKTSGYFWQGRKVLLRPPRASDWQLLYEEERDSEGIQLLEAGIQLPRSPERIQETMKEWLERYNKQDDATSLVFIVETPDEQPVGMAVLHSRNARNGTFSFAIRIYRLYRGHGYAKDAVQILLKYGFEELRYQKANSVTTSNNEASIYMHQELGFRIEGRLRHNVYTGGEYSDEVLFGMTRDEYDALSTDFNEEHI